MVGRFLALLFGIVGAGAGSQAPGFTLQYMQNLTGRLDELRPIVEQFDADVGRYGYTRAQALAECETATGLLDALCSGYATTIRRYEILSEHFAALEAAGPYARPLLVLQGAASEPLVREIATSVSTAFKPAVPATMDAAAYAGGGFAALWGGLSFVFGLFGAMTGGRRVA